MVHPGSMCMRLAMDTADELEELEGPVWHSQNLARVRKQRQRARVKQKRQVRGQNVREVDREKEEGTLSGNKYVYLL